MQLDYSPIDQELVAMGINPTNPALVWDSSNSCLDGSCTITVRTEDGRHIASAFCPALGNE